jgi:5S rRNA maturation endonuclease (ribonuclease M5)
VYDKFLNFESRSGSQLYAKCPFHDDSTASFTVNEDKETWYCHGCGIGGHYAEFIEKYFDVGNKVAQYISKQYEYSGKFVLPTEEYVAGCMEVLWTRPTEIEALKTFGMTEEIIKQYKLGLDSDRVTFPIRSKTGYIVNIRKYLPPHKRTDTNTNKCINVRGLGESRYFPYEAFDLGTVYLVEGEKDCLVARSQGLNAVTSTGGADQIPTGELMLFEGKIVYIMVDNDAAGQRSAEKYKKLLKDIASEIHNIRLPEKDFAEYWQVHHNTDVADYLVPDKVVEEEETLSTTLVQSEFTENLNLWVKLENMSVIGTDPKTYTVPVKLRIGCRDQKCNKPCPAKIGKQEVDVDPRQLLNFVDSPDTSQDQYVKKIIGCRSAVAEPVEYINVQKFMFQESASFIEGLEETTFEHRYGMYMYNDYRLSPTLRYDFESCRVTNPRSQQNYYLVKTAIVTSTSEADDDPECIEYFREKARGKEKLVDILNAHYDTWMPALGIEGRVDLFGAIALTYLSATEIRWKGGTIKGWLDSIVIGDTRTGKSQMAQRFIKRLGKGGYINGENARRTGVVGGVQRFGDSWVVTWGAVPMNDKGLLIIDEASGLTIEDIKELSSTRSSGAVTINKIVKSEARARTRLLWLSNPRSGKNLENFYWKGYGAFLEFIPVAEDQARFDLVLTAARDDVADLSESLEKLEPPVEKWQSLVSYAWNVEASEIRIGVDIEKAVHRVSKSLDTDYGGGPLVVGPAVHEKVIRLSVAIAVLTGCVVGGQVELTPQHVDWAEEFLRLTFDKPTLDYKSYINEAKKANKNREENTQFVRTLCLQYPALKVLLSSNVFRGIQVQEILGIDRSEASAVLSALLQKGLLKITNSSAYSPDKLLVEIVKQMEV